MHILYLFNKYQIQYLSRTLSSKIYGGSGHQVSWEPLFQNKGKLVHSITNRFLSEIIVYSL